MSNECDWSLDGKLGSWSSERTIDQRRPKTSNQQCFNSIRDEQSMQSPADNEDVWEMQGDR